jgi:hypothetical protein
MKRIVAVVAIVLLGAALVASLALPRVSAQTGGTATPAQPAPGAPGGSVSGLAESGAPSGFILTTVVCDIPVFASPGVDPIANTALRAGQTWFVDPILQTAEMLKQQNQQGSVGQQSQISQPSQIGVTGQEQQPVWLPWMSFLGDEQGAWARIYVGSANTAWVPAACIAGEGFTLNGQAFTRVGTGIRSVQQSNLSNQTGQQSNLNNQTGQSNTGTTNNSGQNNQGAQSTPQATPRSTPQSTPSTGGNG